jgi:hypothetical protein
MMKIRCLWLHKVQYVGQNINRVKDSDYDIKPGPHGCYLAVQKSTGMGWLVHAGSCTAEVELPPDEVEEKPKRGKAA